MNLIRDTNSSFRFRMILLTDVDDITNSTMFLDKVMCADDIWASRIYTGKSLCFGSSDYIVTNTMGSKDNDTTWNFF